MTIKSNLTIAIVACLLVLSAAPTTHAQEKPAESNTVKTTQKAEKDEKTKKAEKAKATEKAKESEAKPTEPTPVVVTVQFGDTLESIASAHNTTYMQLFNANPGIANPDAIDVGNEIRVPQQDEQLPDRFGEFAAQQVAAAPVVTAQADYEPVYSQTYTPGSQAVYATDSNGNTYFQGYCTWYAKDRRPDLPNMLGNGGEWVANAAAQGYATGSTPKVGAIAETSGHVAYVEAVNPDGTVVISDMNGRAGFGNVGSYTASAGNYQYIY